jgi:hypothetical protein
LVGLDAPGSRRSADAGMKTALLCAAVHLWLFIYLDARVIINDTNNILFRSTNIPQTYVTTISLILVTAFRAALVASVGICYTQYLWRTFRSKLLAVEVIEDLFQIRANVVRLLNPALFRYTPGLFTVAVIIWLLPLAMIYPPGALIVGIDNRQSAATFNVSIIPPDGVSNTFIKTRDKSGNILSRNGFAMLAPIGSDIDKLVCLSSNNCSAYRYKSVVSATRTTNHYD